MKSISNKRAAEQRAWLGAHRFEFAPRKEPAKEEWHRDGCTVVLERSRIPRRYVVKAYWDEDPLVLLGSGSALFGEPEPDFGTLLYDCVKPVAYVIKIALQMAVGAVAAAKIGWLTVAALGHGFTAHNFGIGTDATLKIIGSALAVAAAVELAYTLFTPGPDEALDPLMLGLSAGLLLLISEEAIKPVTRFGAVLIGVVALGLLFLLRRLLYRDEAAAR